MSYLSLLHPSPEKADRSSGVDGGGRDATRLTTKSERDGEDSILGGRWGRLLSPIAIVVVWKAASVTGILPPKVLAPPEAILITAGKLVASGELPVGLGVSFLRVAAGFSLALTLGVGLAIFAAMSRLGEIVVDPPMQMLKALPFLGLLPLFILWFGIGEAPKLLLIATGSVVPVYLTLYGGIRNIDRVYFDVSRVCAMGRMATVRHVLLPAAMPSLLVGVRYGLSVAWLSLVVAEQINARSGIGAILTYARDFLQTDVIVVCLVVYALMGLATDALVRAIEARLLGWRPPIRR